MDPRLAVAVAASFQNLGHEKVLTTFLNYGEVECQRQGEIMRGLATPQLAVQPDANEIAEAMLRKLRDSGVEVQFKSAQMT